MDLINRTIKKTIIESFNIYGEEYDRLTEIVDDEVTVYWSGPLYHLDDDSPFLVDEDLEIMYDKYTREQKLKRITDD